MKNAIETKVNAQNFKETKKKRIFSTNMLPTLHIPVEIKKKKLLCLPVHLLF